MILRHAFRGETKPAQHLVRVRTQEALRADRLASILDLDMRQFWEADASYWTRIPKADLLAAFAEAPISASQSERSREAVIKAHAKLKKDELATKVGEAFAGVGYLHELLVTPVPAGVFELTSAGVAIAAE